MCVQIYVCLYICVFVCIYIYASIYLKYRNNNFEQNEDTPWITPFFGPPLDAMHFFSDIVTYPRLGDSSNGYHLGKPY